MLSTPASICLTAPSETLPPGLVDTTSRGPAAPGCALAQPATANSQAASVMTAAPRKWRRSPRISPVDAECGESCLCAADGILGMSAVLGSGLIALACGRAA